MSSEFLNEKVTEEPSGTGSAGIGGKPEARLAGYQSPSLRRLGRLQAQTLGGSPGINDSANPGFTKPIPPP